MNVSVKSLFNQNTKLRTYAYDVFCAEQNHTRATTCSTPKGEVPMLPAATKTVCGQQHNAMDREVAGA